MNRFFKSSIGKKLSMAISAIFLMVFLLQHFLINITSVFSESLFNMLSHFMGTNPLVQFLLQPILIAGVIFHFIMGFNFYRYYMYGVVHNLRLQCFNGNSIPIPYINNGAQGHL